MSSTPSIRVRSLVTSVILASVTFSGLPAANAAPVTAAPVTAVGAGVSAPAIAPVVAALKGSVRMGGREREVLRLTNQARARGQKCGGTWMRPVRPLRWNSTLARTAHMHSRDMAVRDYFSHYTPQGVSPFQRMRSAGYRYRAAGENIAAGRSLSDPQSVVRAWLKSPGHCRVLMNPAYRELGVGRVEGAGKWTVYWTQNFGKRR